MNEEQIRDELNKNWEAMKNQKMSADRFVKFSEENMRLMKELQEIRERKQG